MSGLIAYVEGLALMLDQLGHGDSPMVVHARRAVAAAMAAPQAQGELALDAAPPRQPHPSGCANLIRMVQLLNHHDMVVRELNRAGVAEELATALGEAQRACAAAPASDLEAACRDAFGPGPFWQSVLGRTRIREMLGLISPDELASTRKEWERKRDECLALKANTKRARSA